MVYCIDTGCDKFDFWKRFLIFSRAALDKRNTVPLKQNHTISASMVMFQRNTDDD